jgi:gliding motility-associated-like protein
MKILRIFLLFLLSIAGIPAFAQITFFADTTDGCDTLRVSFTYRNTDFVDTVTTVEWDFGNGETASGKEEQIVLYDTAGTYSVSITINGNTEIHRPGYIRVHSTPQAAFIWSDTLELGTYTVVLGGAPQPVDSVPFSYDWMLSDGGTGNTRVFIYRFQEAGEYQARLRVSHPFGCAAQRTRTITVRDSLDCPNVFTPNDDGRNDLFIVKTNGVTVYSLKVFSRSGVLVYQAEAPVLIWDGRNLSGQELLPGTYYYIISEVGGSGEMEKKGFVYLYR